MLRDMAPVRLFVYAGMAYKTARCKAKGEDAALPPADLRKKIRAVDKKRARYYTFYTNQAWGKKENYDLCINTSRYASIKACVPGLAGLIGSLFA